MKKIIIIILTVIMLLLAIAYSQKDVIWQEVYNQYFETAENFSDDKRCYVNVSEEQQAITGKTVPSLLFLQAELSNPKTVIPKNQIHTLMKEAIKRGCEVNDVNYSENLLLGAIIDNDLETFAFLIENGADPSLQVQSPNKKIDGKNIFEFSALLNTKNNDPIRIKTNEFVQSYKGKFEK